MCSGSRRVVGSSAVTKRVSHPRSGGPGIVGTPRSGGEPGAAGLRALRVPRVAAGRARRALTPTALRPDGGREDAVSIHLSFLVCLRASRRCSVRLGRRKEPGAGHESGPRLPASAGPVILHVDAAGARVRRSPWCGGSRHRRRTGAGGGGQTDHVSAGHRCDEQHQRRKDEPCLPRGVANWSLCLHVGSPLDRASRLGRSSIHTHTAPGIAWRCQEAGRRSWARIRRGSTNGWAPPGRRRRTSPCGPSGAGGAPAPHRRPRCG